MQRWPDEALRLAEAEVKVRNQELTSRLSAAIEAGWKPSPAFNVEQAISRCFVPDRDNENPHSDLSAFVLGAFDRVGRPMSKDEEKRQHVSLGDAHVRSYNITVQHLDTLATAKYGDYRNLENNEDTRKCVLKALNEHFIASSDYIIPVGVLQLLGVENNAETRRTAGRILKYWLDEEAIVGKALQIDDGDIHVNVTAMTSRGIKIVEGRGDQPATVHNIFHVSGSPTIGVLGTMTGGSVTQNIGSFTNLASALEQLVVEMRASDEELASVAEAAAERAAALAIAAVPDKNKIGKAVNGLAQLIQTLAGTPQAWALVAMEASKLGYHLPALSP
jgi:hypothetical protein